MTITTSSAAAIGLAALLAASGFAYIKSRNQLDRTETRLTATQTERDNLTTERDNLTKQVDNLQQQVQGRSGIMRTQFFNPNTGQTEMVDQTMRLRSSSQGLVLLGYNPVYAGTNTPNPIYSPDNFLFQIQPDGTTVVFTCDDAGRCSPVEIE